MPLEATVHLCGQSGARESVTLAELLPRSFGPEHLPSEAVMSAKREAE
jgi:cytidine deaminase